MHVRLSCTIVPLLVVSAAWFALAQQSSQTGALMSGRDRAGLRGPVKTVLDEQTFSSADGQQLLTTTTTDYAPDGRILKVQTGNPDTAYATHWEGTDLGFPPYPGGTLTTAYNEQDVATSAQLCDAEGSLVAHIVRKFDAKGRIVAEEQVAATRSRWEMSSGCSNG